MRPRTNPPKIRHERLRFRVVIEDEHGMLVQAITVDVMPVAIDMMGELNARMRRLDRAETRQAMTIETDDHIREGDRFGIGFIASHLVPWHTLEPIMIEQMDHMSLHLGLFVDNHFDTERG